MVIQRVCFVEQAYTTLKTSEGERNVLFSHIMGCRISGWIGKRRLLAISQFSDDMRLKAFDTNFDNPSDHDKTPFVT
jgi:hypothetical protein